jgi:DNA-binding MarR family transcriptional regulator
MSAPAPRTARKTATPRGSGSPAFLLAQVGAHAAARFAERLRVLNLTPPHAGILRVVATSGGISQQRLADYLRVLPSRLVVLIDQLEERGVVERRANARDRRSSALHLTDAGAEMLKNIGRLARDHQEALLVSLTVEEREELVLLLGRVADQQGLRPGVHPGFARLRIKGSKERQISRSRGVK